MKALETFVERENRFSAIFKGKPLSLKSAADRQRIAEKIDSQLSPEHLTCDGELSAKEVRQRHTFLTQAARELMSIDPSIKFYEFA